MFTKFCRVFVFMLVACAKPNTAPAASWLPGATCYEVFVRSFSDSDGDGIGDLRGLTAKLDYINDGNSRTVGDLGARCIWLMPVTESPGYHGYDASDLYRVERDYGTNEDFKTFVAAAHQRGIRVLVDVMLNHVSSEHPAFKEALRNPLSPFRDWFRWSDTIGTPNRWGGQNWHRSPARNEYYYAFFWQGMPDLNYEKPAALEEMKRVATFWLTEMGVDGFRLDAVKYLGEEGRRVDDTPGTHRVLTAFAHHVRKIKADAFTVGEVFDSTSALLPYYPDQLDSYFAFELADSIIAAVRTGSARGVLAPLLRLQREVPSQRWSVFLRNHDQPRTETELGNDPRGVKLAAVLQLTMPGLPFVYYGEELGMTGTKPDERIRTPMSWKRNAPHAGFTTGTPWEALQSDSLKANVEVQDGDSASLLNLYRSLIQLRAAHAALGPGELVPLRASDTAVVAYVRRSGDSAVLIIANLGASPVANLSFDSDSFAIPTGRYTMKPLLPAMTSVAFNSLRVAENGAIRGYRPLAVLPPRAAYVLQFVFTN